MNVRLLGLLAVSVLLVKSPCSKAQVLVVDQASGQLGDLWTAGLVTPTNQIVQSFLPTLPGIGFVQLQTFVSALDPGSSGLTMVLQLREGGSLGPVIATTQPLFLQNLGSQFTTFLFAANVSITPNQTYYIQPTVEGGGVLSIAFKSPSGYLRGDLISNGLTDPLADLWFREGLVIPEPAIGWLALLGAGGIWLYNRRRRGDRGGE